MRRLFAALLALLSIAGCAAQTQGSEVGTFTIQGQVAAYHASGTGGDFVEDGDDVVVRDASTNEMLGLGRLSERSEKIDAQTYSFLFTVEGVPDGRQFYAISVDNSPSKRFARDELDGVLQLTDNR
jgi:hypothetical protein